MEREKSGERTGDTHEDHQAQRAEVPFDIQKIEVAVTKANNSVAEADRMTPVQIGRIAESVELQCRR